MNILIATFGYYPYAFGGTENYVHDQISEFKKKNHNVILFSSLNEIPEGVDLYYQDDYIKVIRYQYEETLVFGILLDIKYTWQIYDLSNSYLQNSYSALLEKANINNIDVLQLNCFTSTLNLNLYFALKQYNKSFKFIYAVHTAFFCMKGTLINSSTKKICDIKINPEDCFNCYYSDFRGRKAVYINTMLLGYKIPVLGSLLRENSKRFTYSKKLLLSIYELLKTVDEFLVYSKLYENILLNYNIPAEKIIVNRHGISHDFLLECNTIEKEHKSFLYSGRLLKLKGAETLFKAWLLLNDDSSRKLYIAFPNIQSNDIDAELISSMKKRNDVIWVEAPSKNELIELYQKVQCLIIPSESVEIGPLVFHEAILAKCNVITSDNSGSKELANHYNDNKVIQEFEMKNSIMLKNIINQFTYIEYNFDEKVKSLESHFGEFLNSLEIEK